MNRSLGTDRGGTIRWFGGWTLGRFGGWTIGRFGGCHCFRQFPLCGKLLRRILSLDNCTSAQSGGLVRLDLGSSASRPASQAGKLDVGILCLVMDLLTTPPVAQNDLASRSPKTKLRVEDMTRIIPGEHRLVLLNPSVRHRRSDDGVVVRGCLHPAHDEQSQDWGDFTNDCDPVRQRKDSISTVANA